MKIWKKCLMAACALSMAAARAETLLCVDTDACAALITADGCEIVSPGEYVRAFQVSENRYALGVDTQDGVRYALCDEEGQLLTDPLYSMLGASGEVILFRYEGLYGAMDDLGNVLVEAKYTQLIAAREGQFLAMTDDPYDEMPDDVFLITAQGEEINLFVSTDEGLSDFSDGLTPFREPATARYGYLNEQGQVAIEAQFETAGAFSSGYARASQDGRMGVIDCSGEWAIAPEYDYMEMGDGIIVALRANERMVVYDMQCHEVFRVEGARIEAAVVGGYPVTIEEDVLKVYSPMGEVLLEADCQTKVSEGLDGQLILSEGEWGTQCVSLMDEGGSRAERMDQHLIPLDDDRYAFLQMNAVAYYSDALDAIRYACDYDSLRYGMMDAQGNEILPAEYLEIRALGEGRYLAVSEQGLFVVDRAGTVIWSHAGEE